MSFGQADRAMKCAARAGVILMRSADEAEVVPGLVEAAVGVDGTFELALRIFRKVLLNEQLAELVVQRRGVRIRAQRRDHVVDRRVETRVAPRPLRIEPWPFVRVLGVVEVEAGTAGGRDDGRECEESFHHFSW